MPQFIPAQAPRRPVKRVEGERFAQQRGVSLGLEDNYGEKILDFNYDNRWYPITDGYGYSLAVDAIILASTNRAASSPPS